MTTVYLSLGSNIGDRAANIEKAIAALNERGVKIVRQSRLYETEPVGIREQDWFLNGVAEAETSVAPQQLMETLLDIEKQMGRHRTIPGGPRLIDLDILFYGNEVIDVPGVQIPHPRLADRRFVLVPLSELAPGFMHPILRKTASTLLVETSDKSDVRPSPPK